MNKTLLFASLMAFAGAKIGAIPNPNLVISKLPAPLCNIMQIEVALYNTEDPESTYYGPASATITLPAGLTFVRTVGEYSGEVTTSGQEVTWTIPYTLRAPDQTTLTFFASANIPGFYTVTGQAIDDQGVTHIFETPEEITLNFPHITNGTYSIAKNGTLVATLLEQLDTTSPATEATSIQIQPNAQHGTALPVLSESPFVVTYIPSLDFVGYDFFTAQASDPCTCTDSASMFVAVGVEEDVATNYATFLREIYNPTPSSKMPVASNITLQQIPKENSTSVDLRDYVDLSNATAPFVYSVDENTQFGVAIIVNETILEYTGMSEGVDTFTYTVTDDNGNASTASVQVTVTDNT